jgi:glycosyltransferase involved in cell wall biosynthesis
MNSIAIILPAYNEELTIKKTIRDFFENLPEAEIVVIDNNSKDRTAEFALETFSVLGAKGRVIAEKRQGKGNAVRRAFMDVDADIYVMADADSTYPAKRIHDLIRPVVENQADMVVGDRLSGGHYQQENKRNFHGFGNNLVKWLINHLFRANLQDVMTGYRAFNRKFVKNYPILVEGFQIETDVTLHALDKRFRIMEIPIEYIDRPAGSFSKLNTFADGAAVLFTIAQILRYYRPLLFFGSVGVGFFLFGLLAGYPVIDEWLETRYIQHVPLAILAVGLEISAIMSMGVGLILDSITHQNKMAFECNLVADAHLLKNSRKK